MKFRDVKVGQRFTYQGAEYKKVAPHPISTMQVAEAIHLNSAEDTFVYQTDGSDRDAVHDREVELASDAAMANPPSP